MPNNMPNEKKLALGPLPPPKEDYAQYEETKILWGRLTLMFGGVFALAFAGLYTLFSPTSDQRVVSVIEQRRLAENELLQSNQAPQTNAVVASIQEVATLDAPNAGDSSDDQAVQTGEIDLQSEALPAVSVSSERPVAAVSSVTTLHPGIRTATLASNIDAQRKPNDVLGYEVSMNEKDLIKVVLHTELQNIEGVTLFHEWHRGDKRYARVKIPVTSNYQGSYSSKFIDKHMMGEWTVQVRDAQGELYAMANFKVVR